VPAKPWETTYYAPENIETLWRGDEDMTDGIKATVDMLVRREAWKYDALVCCWIGRREVESSERSTLSAPETQIR
jgi:hypothetical protein